MSSRETSRDASVLIVDDDRAFRNVYGDLLRGEGFEVLEADDRMSAKQKFEQTDCDVVLLDLMLPPDGSVDSGLEQLSEFLEMRPEAKIVVVSGAGDTQFMLRGVREGAYDFLTKPVDPDVVLVVVERAVTRRRLERQIDDLQASLEEAHPDQSMIGQSPAFERCVEKARRVAPTDLPVLITGEPGTGKELMARSVHEMSDRGDEPFVAVNCGALPDDLLESTLFGHVEGAFTGAIDDKAGLFREADGGTLLLDEVGDMPSHLQVKLLRTLETGDVLPVGADRPVQTDVRIVSATNRDLDDLQKNGTFREDLYWRIKGAEIHLPPLRERPGDIELLAAHFLNQSAALSSGARSPTLSEEAVQALRVHRWPGNLRELRHEMQRAVVMSSGAELQPEDFSFLSGDVSDFAAGDDATLKQKVEALERREIRRTLRQHDGNRTKTADTLGLSRQGLLNKIERYELE